MRRLSGKSFDVMIGALAVLGLVVVAAMAYNFKSAMGKVGESQVKLTGMQADLLDLGLMQFNAHASRYPTTAEGLDALVKRPAALAESAWKGPYLSDGVIPADAWGGAFVYRSPGGGGRKYEIISNGPDRLPGTADDIVKTEDMKTK